MLIVTQCAVLALCVAESIASYMTHVLLKQGSPVQPCLEGLLFDLSISLPQKNIASMMYLPAQSRAQSYAESELAWHALLHVLHTISALLAA